MTKPDRSADQRSSADAMQHLRELVVGPTDNSLEQLRQEVENKTLGAKELSQLLPEAIKRSSADGPGLAKAIGPTFSDAFEESVKRDPQSLADAVSPIMGPAIQRYIQQQIQAMVQSLNTAIDHSLSPKSIGWRLEAWKTGRPFAEIVLLHTLIYRIEQVMLIDPDTGMLMQSASSGAVDDDADLVSSLLTAIQDFMRDSFQHRSDTGSQLYDIQTNELSVWILHGPAAVIAVAIRGEAPLTLRPKIQALLDNIHINYRPLLENFRGDTAPLELVRPDLEELLESEFVSKKGTKQEKVVASDDATQSWKKQLRWILPTILVCLLAGWAWHRQRTKFLQNLAWQLDLPPTAEISVENDILRIAGSARTEWINVAKNRVERIDGIGQIDWEVTPTDTAWVEFIKSLRMEPGITVISANRIGDRYQLHGWRDPESVDPQELLRKSGLPEGSIVQHWDFIQSRDPGMIAKRLELRLTQEGIKYGRLRFHADRVRGLLQIQGGASPATVEALYRVISELQIESSLDLSDLRSTQ